MIDTEYCTYKESMLLKKIGYNEPCGSFYEDLITHNGKSLSLDEELDLRDEGRAKEIKRKAGGAVADHYNSNSDTWLG